MPLAQALCHAHKHLLQKLMRQLQAQLAAVGAFEKNPVSAQSSAAYAEAAEAAAPPLVELLAAYELEVAELREALPAHPVENGDGPPDAV